MVIEIADIEIAPDSAAAFEHAVSEAAEFFRAAPGCTSFALRRSIENPGHYQLVVGWARVEDHTEMFRNSDGFLKWRELAGPFFAKPPVVEHYETPVSPF